LYHTLTLLPHPDLTETNTSVPFKQTNLDIGAFVSYCQQNGFQQFLSNLEDFKIFSKGDNI